MLIFMQNSWQSGDKFHVPIALFIARSHLLGELIAQSKPTIKEQAPEIEAVEAVDWRAKEVDWRVEIYHSTGLEGSLQDAQEIERYYKAWGFGDCVDVRAHDLPKEDAPDDKVKVLDGMKQHLRDKRPGHEKGEKGIPKFPYKAFKDGNAGGVKHILWTHRHNLCDEDKKWYVDVTCAPAVNAGCILVANTSKISLSDRLYDYLKKIGGTPPTLERCIALMPQPNGRSADQLTRAKTLVFLWGRRSGKRRSPGPHPEHTSAARAWNQIAARLTQDLPETPVVRAGDMTLDTDSSSPRLIEHHYLATREYRALLSCFDLTEVHRMFSFNTEEGYKEIYGGNDPLIVQLLMYVNACRKRERKTVHVGMRSGMLIALAYLGIPVVYLEEKDSPSKGKWEAFRGRLNNLVRCELVTLPSSIGQRIQTLARAGLRDTASSQVYRLEQDFLKLAIDSAPWPVQEFAQLFEAVTREVKESSPPQAERKSIRAEYEAQLRSKVEERRRKQGPEKGQEDKEKEKEGPRDVRLLERPSVRPSRSTAGFEAGPSEAPVDDQLVLSRELVTMDLNRLMDRVTAWLMNPDLNQSGCWGQLEQSGADVGGTEYPAAAVNRDRYESVILYYLVIREARYSAIRDAED